mgnify:CR=1 FL=1
MYTGGEPRKTAFRFTFPAPGAYAVRVLQRSRSRMEASHGTGFRGGVARNPFGRLTPSGEAEVAAALATLDAAR